LPPPPTIPPVLGVILDEMRRYVVEELGDPTWSEVMRRSGLPADHRYGLEKAYPDEELGALATQAAEVTRQPSADVLEGFGEAMVPEMFRFYEILANPRWTLVDFLLGLESVLALAYAEGAMPTKVHATQTGPSTMTVVYDLPLRACSAVRGASTTQPRTTASRSTWSRRSAPCAAARPAS
jgi:hypothetical protein